MRYFVLVYNGDCRIVKADSRAPLCEINRMHFGVPYGPKCLGTEPQWRLPIAINLAYENGFKEAIIDGERRNIEPVGVAGVS